MSEPAVIKGQSLEAAPVTDDEFAAFMARLEPVGLDESHHPVCVAVSGGGDSMALAVLARRWRRNILALVVDHALRSESAEEAALTCRRLAALDIPARQLTLGTMKPGGLQERARDARFEALEAACVAAGSSSLLVAHHEADQEETLWMRQERGSGPRGLCGTAGRAIRGRIVLLRPLLTVRPERLRATLRQAGVAWCEDPSNQNRRFRRVAVRQDLTADERQQMHVLRKAACKAQKTDEQHLVALLARWTEWQPEGWVKLSSGIRQEALRDELLGRLIRLVGGQDYMPNRQVVAALWQAEHGALGRACLAPLRGRETGWMLYREARNLDDRAPAQKGQRWDGRWRYLGPERPECVIAALGQKKARLLRAGRDVPACVLPALPVLWKGDDVVAVPEDSRGLCDDLPRVPFVWDSGTPLTGERSWKG